MQSAVMGYLRAFSSARRSHPGDSYSCSPEKTNDTL